jgi:hypothetical protein
MKRTVFLVVALFALMAVGLYAQTEADFKVQKSSDGKGIMIIEYKGSAKEISIPAKIQNLPVTEVFLDNNENITKVTLPNGVKDFQFLNFTSLISVNIPNSVTKLNGDVFGGCTSLATVTIPNSVTSIGSMVFDGCINLKSITIPASVTSISQDAFNGCTSLTSVTFSGSTLSSFSTNAFRGLGDLRLKYFDGGAGTYTRPANGTTWTKSASAAAAPATAAPAAAETAGLAFTAINSNKEYSVAKGTVTTGAVVIPASYNNLPVTEIADKAFNGTQITAVTIPDSVKTIGARAFMDCASLTSVTIGKGVTSIGNMAFGNCAKLTSVTFSGQIPFNSFYQSSFLLQGDIYDKYFAAGGGAGTYTRPSGGETWTKGGSATAAPAAAGTAGLAFTAINSNKEYSVAKGTVTTGAVVIPASYNNLPVTEIADKAFNGTQITAVTIPDSVKTIGARAFMDCASLTSVTIGKGVTSIGNMAFGNCAKLTSVTFSGQIPFNSFYQSSFLLQGDIYDKYFAAGGGAGTYTRPSGGETWTKK